MNSSSPPDPRPVRFLVSRDSPEDMILLRSAPASSRQSPKGDHAGTFGSAFTAVLRFAFPRFFAALLAALLVPCAAAEETASERAAALSRKLTELLAAKPGEAEKTILHFVRNIVASSDGPSLAARLDDAQLLRLARELGKAIPADRKPAVQNGVKGRLGQELLEAIRSLDEVAAEKVASSADSEAFLAALGETKELPELLAVIRDPAHKNNGDTLISLAILLHTHAGGGNFGGGRGIVSSGLPGDVDPSFRPKPHGSNYHLVEISTGKLMATSDWISKLETFSLVRIDADGSTDQSFSCKDVGEPGAAFAERPEGGILYTADADRTTEAGRRTIYVDLKIAGPDGKSETFTDGIPNSGPSCVMGQNDGTTLIAGPFQFFGQRRIFRNTLARLAPDGSVDESFDAHIGGLGVDSFAVQPDGKIVIGGRIENVGGRGRNGVARILQDGTIDMDFHPGWTERSPLKRGKAPENTGTNGDVFCVVLQRDGKILLGGEFTAVAGVRRNLLARLHPDGRLDEDFNPMIGGGINQPAPAIHSLALQTDGKIVIGGNFTQVKGIGRNNIARLLPNGDLDPLFYPCPAGKRFKDNREKAPEDTGVKGRVCSVSLQKDGKVLMGGYLFGVGGLPDGGMTRLLNEPATSEVRRTEAGGVEWLRGGSSPEIERVVLEKRDGDSWKTVSPLTRMAGGWQAAEAPAGGKLRLRGTGRGGQNCGSTFFVVEEVSSASASDSR